MVQHRVTWSLSPLCLTYFFLYTFWSYFVSGNINKEQMAVHTSVGIPGDRGLSSCPCGPLLALMWWTSVSVWNHSCCCWEPPGAGVSPPFLTWRQLGFLSLYYLKDKPKIYVNKSLKHTEYATHVLECPVKLCKLSLFIIDMF